MTLSGGSDIPWLIYLGTEPASCVELPYTDETRDVEAAIAYLKANYPTTRDVQVRGIYRPRTFPAYPARR